MNIPIEKITDYERGILRHLNGEDIPSLTWGAAMSETIGALKGMGLVKMIDFSYVLTNKGKEALQCYTLGG